MKQNSTAPEKTAIFTSISRSNLARIGFLFGCLILLAIMVLPVAAQDRDNQVTDDDVNAIAKEIFCPICESTPLDVCPTQACADWRQVIRDKLAEGQTDDEIRAYFLEQYGPRALAEPPFSGITQPVWIVPILVVTIGGIIFIRFVLQSRRSDSALPVTDDQDASTTESEAEDDGYRPRIESELRDM